MFSCLFAKILYARMWSQNHCVAKTDCLQKTIMSFSRFVTPLRKYSLQMMVRITNSQYVYIGHLNTWHMILLMHGSQWIHPSVRHFSPCYSSVALKLLTNNLSFGCRMISLGTTGNSASSANVAEDHEVLIVEIYLILLCYMIFQHWNNFVYLFC